MRETTRRLLWFAGLALASLAVTAAVSYGLRLLVFFILSH